MPIRTRGMSAWFEKIFILCLYESGLMGDTTVHIIKREIENSDSDKILNIFRQRYVIII